MGIGVSVNGLSYTLFIVDQTLFNEWAIVFAVFFNKKQNLN